MFKRLGAFFKPSDENNKPIDLSDFQLESSDNLTRNKLDQTTETINIGQLIKKASRAQLIDQTNDSFRSSISSSSSADSSSSSSSNTASHSSNNEGEVKNIMNNIEEYRMANPKQPLKNKKFSILASINKSKIFQDAPKTIPILNLEGSQTYTESHNSFIWSLATWKNYVFTGSQDHTLAVFNLETRSVEARLTGHTNSVENIHLVPEYSILASCSLDRTIRLWSLNDFSLLHIYKGHSGGIHKLTHRKDTLFSEGLDGTVRSWSLSDFNKPSEILPITAEGTFSCVFCHGEYLYVSSFSTLCIQKYSLKSKKVKQIEVSGPNQSDGSSVLKVFNNLLVVGTLSGKIFVYDLQKKKTVQTFTMRGRVRDFVYNERINFLYSCGADWTVMVWCLEEDSHFPIQITLPHYHEIAALATMTYLNESYLVTASKDSNWRMIPVSTGEQILSTEFKDFYVRCMVQIGSNSVAIGGGNNIYTWTLGTGLKHKMEGHNEKVVTLSYRDQRLFSGSADLSVRVWDTLSGNCLRLIETNSPVVRIIIEDIGCLVALETNELIRYIFKTEDQSSKILTDHVAVQRWQLDAPIRDIQRSGPFFYFNQGPKLVRLHGKNRDTCAVAQIDKPVSTLTLLHIWTIYVSSQNSCIYTGHFNGWVGVFDLDLSEGHEKVVIEVADRPIIQIQERDDFLFVSVLSGVVNIYSVKNDFQIFRTLEGHTDNLWGCVVTKDAILTGGQDHKFTVRDLTHVLVCQCSELFKPSLARKFLQQKRDTGGDVKKYVSDMVQLAYLGGLEGVLRACLEFLSQDEQLEVLSCKLSWALSRGRWPSLRNLVEDETIPIKILPGDHETIDFIRQLAREHNRNFFKGLAWTEIEWPFFAIADSFLVNQYEENPILTLLLKDHKKRLAEYADNAGRTLLHYAAYYGAPVATKVLLGLINANLRDKDNKTPLEICLETENPLHGLRSNTSTHQLFKNRLKCARYIINNNTQRVIDPTIAYTALLEKLRLARESLLKPIKPFLQKEKAERRKEKMTEILKTVDDFHRLDQVEEMRKSFSTLLFFNQSIPFMLWIILLLVAIYGQSTNNEPLNFEFQNGLRDSFATDQFLGINSIASFYDYLQTDFIDALEDLEWHPEGSGFINKTGVFVSGRRLLGDVQIVQNRIEGDCNIPGQFGTLILECHESGFDESQETYGNLQQYRYQVNSPTYPIPGRIDSSVMYTTDGFTINLSPDRSIFMNQVALIMDDYIDRNTRFVQIRFDVYNVNINRFAAVSLFLEFNAGGSILPTQSIQIAKAIRYWNPGDYGYLVVEVILCCIVALFVVEEVREVWKKKTQYFFDYWNYFEWTMIILFLWIFILRIYELTVDTPFTSTTFSNEWHFLVYLIEFETSVASWLLLLAMLHLLKFLKVLYSTGPTIQALLNLFGDSSVIIFIGIFAWIFFAFVLANVTIAGLQVQSFANIGFGITTLFRALVGDFDYDSFTDENRVIARPILYVVFTLISVLLLLNVFIAVLSDSYISLKVVNQEKWEIWITTVIAEKLHSPGFRFSGLLWMRQKVKEIFKQDQPNDSASLEEESAVSEGEINDWILETRRIRRTKYSREFATNRLNDIAKGVKKLEKRYISQK